MKADAWDDMNIWEKARVLAYDQIRDIEEMDLRVAEIKALAGRGV